MQKKKKQKDDRTLLRKSQNADSKYIWPTSQQFINKILSRKKKHTVDTYIVGPPFVSHDLRLSDKLHGKSSKKNKDNGHPDHSFTKSRHPHVHIIFSG